MERLRDWAVYLAMICIVLAAITAVLDNMIFNVSAWGWALGSITLSLLVIAMSRKPGASPGV